MPFLSYIRWLKDAVLKAKCFTNEYQIAGSQLENTKALRLGAGRLQKAIYQSQSCHPHLLPNTEHKGKAIKIFPVIEFWSKCRKCSLAHKWMYIHPHLHPQSPVRNAAGHVLGFASAFSNAFSSNSSNNRENKLLRALPSPTHARH